MRKLIYYILNYIFLHSLEPKVMRILKDEKKLVIFDIGCFRGIFTKGILKLVGEKKFKFFLFDINKNTREYISNLLFFFPFLYNSFFVIDFNQNYFNFIFFNCIFGTL